MASNILYPPIVNSYEPAFIAGNNSVCRIYFSLSKFNVAVQDFNAHISVKRQENGLNVVKKTNEGRFRAAGIILNAEVHKAEDIENLYYVEIFNNDIEGSAVYGGQSYNGFLPGTMYHVQLRLSAIEYEASQGGQDAWLVQNSSEFSEWSTVCTIKSTGNITISVPFFDYSGNEDMTTAKTMPTITFVGNYYNTDAKETLYSYQVGLYDYLGNLIEKSDILYSNAYADINQFQYKFKTEIYNNKNYQIKFSYTTLNDYTNTIILLASIEYDEASETSIKVLTIENDVENIMASLTAACEEEEEGRVALKLYDPDNSTFTGILYLKRASSRDNFNVWEDIKKIQLTGQTVNELPMFFDYIIESGIWYKYALQLEDAGVRGPLNKIDNPVMRDFDYTFLLGENGKQLKLRFNQTVDNYKINVSDGKFTTIGGRYPFINRNGNMEYRTFNINGMISFYMDERNVFTDKYIVYNYEDIINLYKNYNDKNGIEQYDAIYEREFRELVMKFLTDGKPKLYKSRTEGNIVVRLTDVGFSPEQSLSRIIYNFSASVNEIDDNTLDIYKKYKFFSV